MRTRVWRRVDIVNAQMPLRGTHATNSSLAHCHQAWRGAEAPRANRGVCDSRSRFGLAKELSAEPTTRPTLRHVIGAPLSGPSILALDLRASLHADRSLHPHLVRRRHVSDTHCSHRGCPRRSAPGNAGSVLVLADATHVLTSWRRVFGSTTAPALGERAAQMPGGGFYIAGDS